MLQDSGGPPGAASPCPGCSQRRQTYDDIPAANMASALVADAAVRWASGEINDGEFKSVIEPYRQLSEESTSQRCRKCQLLMVSVRGWLCESCGGHMLLTEQAIHDAEWLPFSTPWVWQRGD